jgi:transposase
MRYELTDRERAAIKPMLPNKPRGAPRVNDRRVLNSIFWVLRWTRVARLPDDFGPYIDTSIVRVHQHATCLDRNKQGRVATATRSSRPTTSP